jgi:hypothetical protein
LVVKRDAPRLSFLILSEDSAPDACEPIAALLKRMLLFVDPAVQTHRIEFEPRDEPSRSAMRGSNWKAEPGDFGYPKLVLLGRTIAAKLLEEADAPGFVIFHIDGDTRWADRGASDNVAKFPAFVRNYVVQGLDAALRKRRDKPLDEAALATVKEAALARLIRLTPFWCIEAWLYQNTALVHRFCEERCGAHLDEIKRWAANRGALDEVRTPKKETCFGSQHNAELARTGYPAADVFAADKSYAAAVMSLLDCPDLCAALERTWA